MDFIRQFREARRVSTPIVAIRTFDAKSTVDMVRGLLGTKELPDTPMMLWDAMNGLRGLTEVGAKAIAAALQACEMSQTASVQLTETLRLAEKFPTDTILFVANAHLHWAVGPQIDPSVVQGIWNLRDPYKANANMIVLLCSPGSLLPAELANDTLVLDEPLPTTGELAATVRRTFADARLPEPPADTLRRATDALIGLPSFPADQATAMSLSMKTKQLDIDGLWERKRQIINQTQGLSVWPGNEKLADIGGLEAVKTFCCRVMEGNEAPKTIIFIDEIEKAFAGTGTDMSGVKTELTGAMLSWMQDREIDGMIFIGLPGVSKSQLAKSLGGTYGTPTINFDLAGMQSALVGSSGTNLRTAQRTVDAISGGRTLAIATCNSITALPPELRRRFNLGIFFFDAPNREERAAIWDIYLAKYGLNRIEPIPQDEGWTGAEIKECCKKAYRLKMSLVEAAQYIVPVTRSSQEIITALRLSASGKYLSASKPGVYESTEPIPLIPGQAVAVAIPMGGGRKMREQYDS